MSRRSSQHLFIFPRPIALAIVLATAALTLTVPAHAQDQEKPDLTAETVLTDAKAAYGPPPPKPKCGPQTGDEIVVCAEEEEQSQFRVKSSSQLDPESEEALNDGLPRAPDVGGPGIFKGPATVGKLCIPGLQKCPPPPAIFVDFSALPEAPPGSDADRIGRGLAPTGNDGGDPIPVVEPDKISKPEPAEPAEPEV